MKFLKIILIFVLLSVSCIAYGTGTITSGDKTVDMVDIKEMYSTTDSSTSDLIPYVIFDDSWKYREEESEEPTTLNEWFYSLELSEKIEIYNNFKEVK